MSNKVTQRSAILTADLMRVLGVPADATNVQIVKIGVMKTDLSWSVPAPSATAPAATAPAPAPEEVCKDPASPDFDAEKYSPVPKEVTKKATKKATKKKTGTNG